MRTAILLAACALGAGTAWSQSGTHVATHGAPPVSAPHISMNSHAAPFHPSTPPSRSTPNHTAHAGSLDTQGNWTSSGFVPSQNGTGTQYSHQHHANAKYGYGPVGYPIFAYPAGYLNGGLNLDDDDPNDPNHPTGPAAGSYPDNAPPAQGDGYYGPPDTARAPYDPGGYQSAEAHALPGASSAKGSSASSDGMGHPMVTLIFKDGRTPLKIQNYALSQTKIFVRDHGTDRDIAISDLDVPATMSANDQAGIDFELPVAR